MYQHPFLTGLYEQYKGEPGIAACEAIKAMCGFRRKELEEGEKVR